MVRLVLVALALAAGAGGASAQSSCGQYDFAGPYANAFLAAKPFTGAETAAEVIVNMADGACHQEAFVRELGDRLGPVVGYKAAATSPGAQKQLGLDGPVLGVLFRDMLREDGAVIGMDEGVRMIFELDLLARVGDAALNEAKTREEALAALDAFVPFVEIGDFMVPKGAAVTGPLLLAMNAGARLGVHGEPISTEGLTVDDVAAVTGRLEKDGSVVAEAPATALLGHPLDAVLWIVAKANARGRPLKEGDLLSLGSMGRFQIASPGTVAAHYQGFGEEPASVTLTLE